MSMKRFGRHHKVDKRYTKTYWPYLPMLAIVLAGLILNATWRLGQQVLGYATDMGPVSLLTDTNAQRSQNGIGNLSLNTKLTQAAQAKADDMAARNYWSHTTPDGAEPWQFISDAGYTFITAGENLAYGFYTSQSAVAGWMNSPSHRANILNASYQEVGFGVADSPDFQGTGEQTIVVAMYAQPKAVAAVAPVPTPAPVTIQRSKQAAPSSSVALNPSTPNEPEPALPPAAKATPAQSPTSESPALDIPSREVARIDVLTQGNAQWLALALSATMAVCITSFAVRHGQLWKRYLVRGERFMIKHPVYDMAIVAVAMSGYILTQAAGFVR